MPVLSRARFVASLAVLGWLGWYALEAVRPPARWVSLEAPRRAFVGGSYAIRVRLVEGLEAGRISIDLHWSTARHKPRGFLSSAGDQPMGTSAADLAFQAPIPEQPDLGFVHAVVFLSSTGRWADRTRVALSALIPVEARPAGAVGSELPARSLRVYDPEPVPLTPVRQSAAVRAATVLLLAGSALLVRRKRPPRGNGDVATGRMRQWGGPLFWAFLIGAVSEAFSPGEALANAVRAAALAQGSYHEREPLQQLLTVVVVLSMVAWGVQLVRGSSPILPRVAWAAWVVWLGVALAGALSLHAIDRLDATEVTGFSTLQVVRLVAAAVAFAAVWGWVSGAGGTPGDQQNRPLQRLQCGEPRNSPSASEP